MSNVSGVRCQRDGEECHVKSVLCESRHTLNTIDYMDIPHSRESNVFNREAFIIQCLPLLLEVLADEVLRISLTNLY